MKRLQQFPLFGPTPDYSPKSHRDDPATSREAANGHVTSGRFATNIELVLALVRRHPGKTANELFRLATPVEQYRLGDHYEVRRRLVDLSDPPDPLVRKGSLLKCESKGKLMTTWEVI